MSNERLFFLLLLCMVIGLMLSACPGGLEQEPYSMGTGYPDGQVTEPENSDGTSGNVPTQNANADTSNQGACADKGDGDTLALFPFEADSENEIKDVQGGIKGQIVGDKVTHVAGKEGCGQALNFPGENDNYILVPNSEMFADLAQGSIDFWFRLEEDRGREQGLISRDASNQHQPGHLAVLVNADGAVRVRLQDSEANGNDSFDITTPKVTDSQWHHLGINFGPPGFEVFLDKQKAGSKDTEIGINGNHNPWVFGALSWKSSDGQADVISAPLRGMIDSVRISKKRRDFAK